MNPVKLKYCGSKTSSDSAPGGTNARNMLFTPPVCCYFIFINIVLSGIFPLKGLLYLNVTPQQSPTCRVFVLFVFVWYIVVAFSTL